MNIEVQQDEKTEKDKEDQVSLEDLYIPRDFKAAQFCNIAYAKFSGEEFVIDFMNMLSISKSVVSRIIMTPSHTKRLVALLDMNIKEYEKEFGEIPFEVKQKKIK